LGGSYDTPEQWKKLAELIDERIRGVTEGLNSGDSAKIMIHIERSVGSRWFFDNLFAQGVDFDLIGLSYYPWGHGTSGQVSTNLNSLAREYGKDLVIVETAYPWTLQWADSIHNQVGDSSQLKSRLRCIGRWSEDIPQGYPEDPGQLRQCEQLAPREAER